MGGLPRWKSHNAWERKADRALGESIAHWVRLRDGKRRDGENCYGSSCACCCEFYGTASYPKSACGECPLFVDRGLGCCTDTPYGDAASEFLCNGDTRTRRSGGGMQRLVDYLRNLRAALRAGKLKDPTDGGK